MKGRTLVSSCSALRLNYMMLRFVLQLGDCETDVSRKCFEVLKLQNSMVSVNTIATKNHLLLNTCALHSKLSEGRVRKALGTAADAVFLEENASYR